MQSFRHNLRICLLNEETMLRFWDTHFLYFQPFHHDDVTISIGTRGRVQLWRFFWIVLSHLVMKLEHLIDISMSNIFSKYFAWFWNFKPFLIYQPTVNNQKPIMMGLWFSLLNCAMRLSKIVNIIYTELTGSTILSVHLNCKRA